MSTIRLAAAALNQTPLAWDANRRHILEAIDAARDAGAGILCLPECAISGYGCEDTFLADGTAKTSLESLAAIIPHTQGLSVAIGLPLRWQNNLYNAAALAVDGVLLGFACKQVLAGDGIHYEPRWFTPWTPGQTGQVDFDGQQYPVGDLLFDCDGVRIGFEICRDAWVEGRPGERLARLGVDVLLNPSASHFAFAKQDIRRRIVLDGSRDFHAAYVYANLLGNESGRVVYDGGTLIASGGEMLVEGVRFSFDDYVLTCADVDLEATRQSRVPLLACPAVNTESSLNTAGQASSGTPVPSEDTSCDCAPPTVVRCSTSIVGLAAKTRATGMSASQQQPAPSGHITATWDTSPPPKEEEFARAVPLALFDYLRKSRAGGLVVSLSGGADSSAVAVLVWLMVRLGVGELGREAFAAKLPQIVGLEDAPDESAMVRRLLTCVYQATRNSSQTTRDAARTVAEAVGAEFLEWNVDSLVDTYVDTVSKAIGRKLDWDHDDLALQNIQARARGPAVWLLANLRGGLLLTTSNRSEAAVGYATMDGDTCGGLAPIAGIDKAFLLQWLQWMETTGPKAVGPLPALQVVNAQQPTAELRPPGAGQTDEADLMPYRVLDAIERSAIRDKQTPVEVLRTVTPQFPEHPQEQLTRWIERFFNLWCRNQWKRERYAPSFHLDDENLDPKTWCRFPILSGGFERELEELRR